LKGYPLGVRRRLKACPTTARTALLFLSAALLPAQTLQQAETLWQQHRMLEANETFKALCDREIPQDAACKVRWGRMYLEYGHSDDAFKLFDEALAIDKNQAGAVLGEALLAADRFDGNAPALARRALELDPRLLEAQELLARLALEDNDNARAAEEAQKALAMDSNSMAAKAVLASMDLLAGKPESPFDPHTARGYETIGHFFMLNRRYEESIGFYRKAVELDPRLLSARSELGIGLMRLGRNGEAFRQLELSWENHFQSKATANSLRLLESFDKKFVTFATPRTILRFDKKEGDFLRPYFQSEMERVISVYEKKYRMKLDHAVQVEAYPDHEDFAVRTLGMPGFGALGVTFGYTIAMDSPSGRPPGQYHWASTLWHEMSHVFTLAMTDSRVPRWFTEGIAVYEETAVNPEWGDRLGPDELAAIRERQLLPVASLDRGFIHPSRPQQIPVSYFQAGRICGYITKKWGWDAILAMLHDYAQGADTPTVFSRELKLEPADFDRQFLAEIEAETKPILDHLDEWKKSARELADMASKAEKSKDQPAIEKALQLGRSIENWYPEYVEDGSVYESLAALYLARGDRNAAIGELWRYVRAGGRSPARIELLAANLVDAGRQTEAAAALDRLNYIYPMDPEQHQKLGGLWLDQGNAAGAIREYRAVLARNPIDPAQAHYNLARAYRSNRQEDLARDEVLAALEIAPGFRPAQKLLLELN
jgi:tetratricopeptide (TPR) repeat protein